jgi:prepilin-type N-terminal cleavage/methylation domain-containing protein
MMTTFQLPGRPDTSENRAPRSRQNGFTLTELAVVLVIVALLIGGMLMPLSAQDELRRTTETQKTLGDIRDALLGFAAANGRLPCPATAASSGKEEPAGGGNCDLAWPLGSNSYAGFVPAATLGITPTDSHGYAIDAWGNPIRYAVFPKPINDPLGAEIGYPFTSANGLKTVTLNQLASYTKTNPLLSVCSSGDAVTNPQTGNATCTAAGSVTNQAVAVIYSLGKNAGSGGAGRGEQHNPNPNSAIAPDPAFVSHTQTAAGSDDGEFDDIVIWLSPNILYNKMIAAGRLP